MSFRHTPYDTLPFYIEYGFWNKYGYGALWRRAKGLKTPLAIFGCDGISIEAMGAPQADPKVEGVVHKKVIHRAAELKDAPFGYRPEIGYQAGRLVAPVKGPSYGSEANSFPDSTPLIPASVARFEKQYQRRGGDFSKIDVINNIDELLFPDPVFKQGPEPVYVGSPLLKIAEGLFVNVNVLSQR